MAGPKPSGTGWRNVTGKHTKAAPGRTVINPSRGHIPITHMNASSSVRMSEPVFFRRLLGPTASPRPMLGAAMPSAMMLLVAMTSGCNAGGGLPVDAGSDREDMTDAPRDTAAPALYAGADGGTAAGQPAGDLVVLIASFADAPPPELARDAVRELVFGRVAELFSEASYGAVTLSGDVFGTYALP